MAAYVDYIFYTTIYAGTTIAETDFPALAIRATRMVSYLTFDRADAVIDADEDADIVEAIKLATCAVADKMLEVESSPQQIQSERVGSHSITYAQNSYQLLPNERKYLMAAKPFLVRTGLLYRGFLTGEYAGEVNAD